MNIRVEEQILIKDIFNVDVSEKDSSAVHLRDFPKEIAHLGAKASLIENSTYFDSLLMERLQIPGTQTLAYLEDCLMKSHYVLEKPWNSNDVAQKFINYSIEIIKNFIFLSLQEPEIFSEQLVIDADANKCPDQILSIAMKMMTHFQRKGFNVELIQIIYPKIQEEIKGDFAESFLDVLLARQRFQNILEPKAYFYSNLFSDLMNLSDFKQKLLNLKKTKFIPGEKDKILGSAMDTQSPFGLFARMSVLGTTPGYYHQENEVNAKFEERMMMEFGKQKFGRDKMKFYANLQNEFYGRLTQIYKSFMKKDSQKQFLEWNYALIFSNLKKSKLGFRLQNTNASNLSHDGLMLNIYVCLLNLCKIITNKAEGKYKSIDPEYFVFNDRVKENKYEKLNKKQNKNSSNKMEGNKEFGTITQFYFLCWELVHVGLTPAMDNFVEYMDLKEKIEKEKGKYPPGHPMSKKIEFEINRIQSKLIRYYIIILDEPLIMSTVKLFDLSLFLLPQWLKFDYDNLVDGRIKNYKMGQLAQYLPEFFLDSIHKFHSTNFKFKQGYLQLIGEEHITQLIKLTCLLLSEEEIISNPYIGANFIELIFAFLHENKTGIMSEVFRKNTVAHQNLTYGLIRFYCDIAVTGSSHQFYQKFKYRFYANKIFTSLWLNQIYRKNLTSYFDKPIFQRFLNMVMTDTTYCFDQTNQNYSKFKVLEAKKQEGELSAEDQKNQEQISGIIGSTLNQSTSNLKLMRDLSAWSPQTFLHEAERKTVVPLLNIIVKTFVDPTSFMANRQLLSKFKFQKELVLSDLIQIYANIDINDKLSNQIVKDTRNYKKQHFSKALQRASNEHYTSIQILQKFEELINKLSTAINEEENEEIYGEIPEKYLCSLMSTLMKDPVLLPGSGNIVDRVNIHRCLLNDERDPFTRGPLKLKELIEQKALKEEIDNWKKKRLKELEQGNKQVKYGSIAAAKKKEGNQQNQIYTNSKLIESDEDE